MCIELASFPFTSHFVTLEVEIVSQQCLHKLPRYLLVVFQCIQIERGDDAWKFMVGV